MRAALMIGSLIATTVASTACHTMRPVTLDEVGASRPGQVWVTLADQSVVVVAGPQVYDKKLVGFVDGKYRVVPPADVKQMMVQQRAHARTGALIVAGGLGVVGIAALLTGGGGGSGPCQFESSECDASVRHPALGKTR